MNLILSVSHIIKCMFLSAVLCWKTNKIITDENHSRDLSLKNKTKQEKVTSRPLVGQILTSSTVSALTSEKRVMVASKEL